MTICIAYRKLVSLSFKTPHDLNNKVKVLHSYTIIALHSYTIILEIVPVVNIPQLKETARMKHSRI